MKIISNHAIWNGNSFDNISKEIITTKEKTVVEVISCGFCGTDKHTLDGENGVNLSLGHEILAKIIHLGTNHRVVNNESLENGDRIILIPGKNCGECCHCINNQALGNLCGSRSAHGWGKYDKKTSFIAGGFSTHIELMDDCWLIKVPKDISNDVAVLAEPLAIAIRAVDRALTGIRPDRDLGSVIASRVAVIGLGSIGYLVAYVLNTLGADVVGFDVNDKKCKFFNTRMNFQAIKIDQANPESIVHSINNKSSIKDFDLVFECAGTTSAFTSSLLAARKGGRVIELGNYIQNDCSEIDPSWICRKELDILGFVLADPTTYIKVFKLLRLNSLEKLNILTKKIPFSQINDLVGLSLENEIKVIVENGR